MRNSTKENLLILAACIFILALSFGAFAVAAYFEARAYNNVTGSNVSTWDAMFIDLRVQAEPNGKGKSNE